MTHSMGGRARIIDAPRIAAAGLGIGVGAIVMRGDRTAVDSALSAPNWRAALAAAVVSAVILAVVNRRPSRRSDAAMVAYLTGCASVGWIALAPLGATAVVRIVTLGTVLATTYCVAVLVSHHRAAPTFAAGVGLGAFAMFLWPDGDWADVGAVGGVAALAGSVWWFADLTGAGRPAPDTPVDSDAEPPTRTKPVTVPVSIGAGVLLGGVVRVGNLLRTEWDAGVRYGLLVMAMAGAVASCGLIAQRWRELDDPGWSAERRPFTTRLLVGAATGLLVASASLTLPGIVIASTIAAAVAFGCATADTDAAASLRSIAICATAIAVTALGFDPLSRIVDGDRSALALVALLAVALGSVSWYLDTPSSSAQLTNRATIAAAGVGVGGGSDEPQPGPGLAQPTAHRTLLAIDGLDVWYGRVQVLFGVELTVDADEIHAIVGANGAGKTTLLSTIAGLRTPARGRIGFGGQDLAGFDAAERVRLGINQIAVGAAVAEDLTVAENIAMFGLTLDPASARRGAARVYETFPQLAERRGQRAGSLSGGERQLLALTKSLVLRPRLLIIDELSLGLAPVVVAGLVPIVRRLHAEGAAVLLVEQAVPVALGLADRATCMEKGAMVFSNSATALLADPGLLEAAYLDGMAEALEQRGLTTAPQGAGHQSSPPTPGEDSSQVTL